MLDTQFYLPNAWYRLRDQLEKSAAVTTPGNPETLVRLVAFHKEAGDLVQFANFFFVLFWDLDFVFCV